MCFDAVVMLLVHGMKSRINFLDLQRFLSSSTKVLSYRLISECFFLMVYIFARRLFLVAC